MSLSFEQELRSLPQVATKHRNSSKYRQIRQHLEQSSCAVAAGTRLPTLRNLSVLLGATRPTILRAIKELVADGVLQTKAKSGIFVARTPADRATVETPFGLAADTRTLALTANAPLPHQQRFWNETIAAYQNEHRHIRVRLDEVADSRQESNVTCDLIAEYLPRGGDASIPESSLQDLGALLAPEAARSFGNIALPQRARRWAPFQMSVPCVFVNLQWAQKCKLARPAGERFADVCAFLEAGLKKMPKRPSNAPISIIAHQPVCWLGKEALKMIELASGSSRQSAEAEIGRFLRNTERALSAWRRFDIGHVRDGITPRPLIRNFTESRIGFYFGFSYEIGLVLAENPDFPWQVLPMPAVDDRVPVLLECLAITDRTPYPVECVRFIEHMLTPATQQRLADCSLTPLDTRLIKTSADPAQSVFAPAWNSLSERMTPIYPADADGDYVYRNIFTDDLYRCLDSGLSAQVTMENMLRHARAYLRRQPAAQKKAG